MKKYNKLVRDKIPEIIKNKGEFSKTHIATDDEYWQLLLTKLNEEAEEYSKDPNLSELADILEVINAIIEFKNVDINELEKLRLKKKEDRGGFSNRIVLEEAD
jgi:predicted house-cleaning noncanonical NTP pyrophosphatase (MazG superfamily)